jgi:hypothetical protein
MSTHLSSRVARSLALAAVAALVTACAEDAPLAPAPQVALSPRAASAGAADVGKALAAMRRATSRYHDVNAAIADGFFELHPCESLPGKGPVGTLYVHMDRLNDGLIQPWAPDALLYEPSASGRPTLVGVEFAVFDVGQAPPQLLGATFQRETEFGVFALHAWVWRHNPEGMFAETNPRVSCGAE